jgi:hypothetical protein
MDEDTLSVLVLDHLVEALHLAVGALDLVNVPQEVTLADLEELGARRQDLEISTVMLLRQAGVSWEAMADQLGVTRQSLNRRLSQKSTARQGRVVITDGYGLRAEWSQLLRKLQQKVQGLIDTGAAGTSRQVAQELLAKHPTRHPSF